ncbi:MAG: hypothetical protein U0794_05935 [Isosphaeraceae bacterium]
MYYLEGKWYGEEVSWKRSGSGEYREISRVDVPQSRREILRYLAREPLLDQVARLDPGDRQSAEPDPGAPVSVALAGAFRRSGNGFPRDP